MRMHSSLFLFLMVASVSAVGCGGSSSTALLQDSDASTTIDPDGGAMVGPEASPPEGCRTSLDCPAGKVCDSAAKSCFECVTDRDCDPAQKCQAHACVTPVPPCKNSLDCAASPIGKVCEATSGKCVACVMSADCPENNDCVSNVCKAYTPCANSLDCPKGKFAASPSGAASNARAPTIAQRIRRVRAAFTGRNARRTRCAPSSGSCAIWRRATASSAWAPPIARPRSFASTERARPTFARRGSSSCQTNAVVTCRSDGSGYGGPSPCTAQQTCIAAQGSASCKDKVCAPSVTACDAQSQKVIKCSADGLSFTTISDCAAASQVCISATCTSVVCEPGKQYCKDGAVRKCSAQGDTTTLLQTCTAGQFCDR